MSDADVNGHPTDETVDAESGAAADGASAIERYEPEHPWQRQPGESSRGFGRFCEYRDLGANRSLSRLGRLHADEAGWSLRALEELSVRWRWGARAAAWDEEQDRARRQAQLEAIQEMAERQARDGADMQKLARGAMARWLKTDPQTGQLVLARELGPSEACRLYVTGFQVERTARGEPTQVTEQRIAGEVEYDDERIAAGIAFALAQSVADEPGMGGSGEENSLPASPAPDAQAVDGGPVVDSGQAEPGGAAATEPDPAET